MNWLTVLGLTLAGVLLLFAALRVERRAIWAVLLLLWVPALLAIGYWANTRRHWPETLAGLGIAVLVVGAWWLWIGRRLARPNSDVIKVWGQEPAGKGKAQESAALQAEVARLKDEAARLEAEVRRLRRRNGHDQGSGPGAG